MALMDSRIILAGQPVNTLGALAAGTQVAAQTNAVRDQNSLRDLYQTQGQGILSGDTNALNALAGLDPMAALDVQNVQDQRAERQERLQMARAAAGRAAAQHAATMSAAEREAEAEQIRRGLTGLSSYYSRGDQTGFQEMVDQMGFSGEVTWENFESQAAMYDGVLEVLETFDERNAPAEPVRGTEFDGNLVNPFTGEVIAEGRPEAPEPNLRTVGGQVVDFSDPSNPQVVFGGSGTSAAEEEIARLMETGLSRDLAIGIADGRYRISRDPVTGAAQVVDMAQVPGAANSTPSVFNQEQPLAPVAPQTEQPAATVPGDIDYTSATGVRGAVNHIMNTIGDVSGMGLISPENEEATQALSNLRTRTVVDLQGAVAGRPSNFLLEMLQNMTVQPNSITQGPERAQARLRQTRDVIAEGIRLNQEIRGSAVSPTLQSEAEANVARLTALLRDYDTILNAFEGPGVELTPEDEDLVNRWAD